jgi:amino acid adenylation domain-containing protein
MIAHTKPRDSFIEFTKEDAEGTILDRFEKQAHKYADKTAVKTKTIELTYGGLNQASNRLAQVILNQYGQSNEPVPLLFEQGANIIIAFLGVLKAGRIWTALNPSWPDAGLAPILKDLQAKLILTDTINIAQAETLGGNVYQLINIDEIDEDVSINNPGLPMSPHAPSHIIYTSGSTGQPNGVVHTHRNILHYIREQTNSFHLCPDDRMPLFFSLSHSAGMTTTFRALLNGATLFPFALREEGVLRIPDWIKEEKITFFHTFPSILRQLPGILVDESYLTSIRLIHIGGEPVTGKDVAIYQKWFPDGSLLINSIGCTEVSTFRRFFINKETQLIDNLVPVGYEVEDKEVFLIDEAGNKVEPGCIGEIAVRSPYLALGYWRNPELTHRKFLPDPEGADKRIYLTGDMGRIRQDGCLEYIGRKDFQVQIRGFRVETEAIDTALYAVDSVKQAVVAAREDEYGESRLIAYVVPTSQPAPTVSELRRSLAGKLPDYMIPSAFVFCDALPMTQNGKVDRRALPLPGRSRPDLAKTFTSPKNETEAALADIWAQVLNFDRIGIDDNFFDLGGHSLSAARIISMICDTFQINLPLDSILKSPTVRGLAAEISKHKIYHAQLEGAPFRMPEIRIESENKHQPFPLTEIQQAYWIGRTGVLALGNVSAHRYMEIESIDPDMERLNQSWQQLIERHDMLRAIMLPDGQQKVLEHVPFYEIKILDLREKSPDERQSTLNDIRKRMSHQVLPVDRWPLFEILASRLDNRRFRIHMSFDALIMDSWSRFIVFREWSRLYHLPKSDLKPLEISFRDYVLAEEKIKDSVLYRDSRKYWLNRLSTLPPAPDLPLSKNPEDVSLPRFTHWSSEIEPETWKRLKRRAAQVNLTSSGLLLASFSEVLKVWSKSPVLTLNLTHFDRRSYHPQVDNIVGDFTLVTLLEVNNSEHPSFETRALCLQRQLWKDLGQKYFNGVRVLRELARKRTGLPKGLMPIVFTSTLTHDTGEGAQNPTSWLGKTIYNITQTPQVWIDHQIFEESGTLVFNWAVVAELFPDGLIDDMFSGYCELLKRLAENESAWQESWPETAEKLVPPVQLKERAVVNATETSVPTGLLHTLFATQVPERPDQPAVVAPDRILTYEELFFRSNQVGRRLRQLGARPNKLVAVVMEKGWEQVVAVLGILASGAAYLPIEAGLPKERLWYLLEHGEVELVLTQSRLDQGLDWPEGLQRVCVDDEALTGVDNHPLDGAQGPEDLAYVIYTSGSTGLPKGVMIDHRGAVNTILDINKRFGVGQHDRVLALSALSFDLSVYDIFGTLAAGGTIVMPEQGAARDPSRWAQLIAQKGVTIWNSVPTLMALLAEYVANGPGLLPSSLRLVLLSGDWIPLGLPDQIKTQTGEVQIISLGGATEASIWSILHPIETVDPNWESIPYGRPMVNQRFHVLNEALAPCPLWVPGQLYIGGVGLAKGYWRDEEKTQRSFITHPRTGERLYRTGDLGRYLPDGNIEFLGREDFQVKIQGYRVELGEIEAALGKHPEVRTVVVKAVGELQGDKRLVAYVVQEPKSAPGTSELRHFVQQKLPEYMIPSAFVLLDELPLTPNGKVDREALPDPSEARSESLEPSVAEASDLTARIGQLVARILGIDQIDPEANLLNLGATSVHMIRIANLLESQLDFRPKIDELYRLPTVMGLARSYEKHLLESRMPREGVDASIERTPESVLASFPLIVDPEEREAFKNKEPGLRQGDGEKPCIELPMTNPDDTLKKKYVERRSYRQFSPQPIPFARLSELLGCLHQIKLDGKPKYLYGSAGGLYPVQTYLYIKPGRVEGVDAGIYYYHCVDHHLVLLSPHVDFDRGVYDPIINRPIFDEAAFGVFLIAQLSAISPMYGARSMHYATIEAGLMSQLLETSAPACGIGFCQIGNLDFKRIQDLFELDQSHVLVHSLLGGLIDIQKSEHWSPFQEARGHEPATLGEREEGEI